MAESQKTIHLLVSMQFPRKSAFASCRIAPPEIDGGFDWFPGEHQLCEIARMRSIPPTPGAKLSHVPRAFASQALRSAISWKAAPAASASSIERLSSAAIKALK